MTKSNFSDFNLGNPYLIYIYPFINPKFDRLSPFKQIDKIIKSSLIEDFYVSNSPNPQSDILKIFSTVDEEVYSDYYRCNQSYYRFYLGRWCVKELDGEADVIITYHNKGWGTALFIMDFSNKINYLKLMTSLHDLQKSSSLLISSISHHNEEMRLDELLVSIIFPNKQTNKNYNQKSLDYKLNIGEPFPFSVLYSEDLNILSPKLFVEKNHNYIYGLANIDYWGWKRTIVEETTKLFKMDLSRREEYAFFLTQNSALEIDSINRMKNINEWAKKTNLSPRLMHIKLLLERVLIIETLRGQYHAMISLDSLISEALENKKNFQLLGIFRAKIADGLNDFYNIRSQNKAQVSGINWIIYGQHCMGIDRLYDSIKERIESLEIYYDIYMKSAAYQITAGLSLLSVFLAATASSQIMDMIAKIPMFQQYHIDNWKWLPSIILFLLFVTISVTTFVRSNKLVKHL